ncbi:MAG TPA: murein transglycosylase A [Novosphingobium sp.]|nr:murein transglycosylase A [Novosphingobium sp.]
MVRARLQGLAALASLLLLGSCALLVPSAQPPQSTTIPTSALLAGVAAGPAVGKLGLGEDDARGALASFRESCPRLLGRQDESGLTTPLDWKPACDASAKWPDGQSVRFFETWFETARVGDGQSFITGYYEPEIAGVRQRRAGFDVPVYAVPPDLIRAKPGEATPQADGQMPKGRYDGAGRFVPYYERGDIDDGALMGRGLEIAWAADPIEFFFLQIQGSGRLRAPDGTVTRIGYAGQNGFPFTGIGSLMRERGLIGEGPGQYPGSMQGMMRYLREHPAEGRALMRMNRSYVFFRVVEGDGPIGALGVPVRGKSSAAVDPAYVPLGAPVWLDVDRKEASGLWIAQDTGGAIKGANRFDSFWGAGAEARQIAGGMIARGGALLLLPRGTVARIRGR